MSGDTQLKSIIDRILRLKSEQDDIALDIREIYAEAKGNGFDKTQLGKVVSYLRNREKVGPDAINEGEAIFDLYLSTYLGEARPSHAHAREETPHDPETGEITEHEESDAEGHRTITGPDARPAGESASPVFLQEPRNADEGLVRAASEQSSVEGSQALLPSDPAENKTGGPSVIAADKIASGGAEASAPIPFRRKPLRPHCLNRECCAASGPEHCFTCRKALAEQGEGSAA